MLTVGRTWVAGSQYRYGFNGMENDDEIAGNDNSLDFGDRMYNPRLGRWFSVDPLFKKYSQWSPYVFAMNNSILVIDIDGSENVIYLVAVPSDKTFLTTEEVASIAEQATRNFESMGLKTQVVVVDYNAFDPTKIDMTDGIAVIGQSDAVADYISKNDKVGSNFGDYLKIKPDWGFGGNYNPEVSEHEDDYNGEGDEGGQWIALDAGDIKFHLTGMNVSSTGSVKFGALLINHGAGHLSNENHYLPQNDDDPTWYGDVSSTFSYVMAEDLPTMISTVGYGNVVSDNPNERREIATKDRAGRKGRAQVTNNGDYVSSMKTRFGNSEPNAKLK